MYNCRMYNIHGKIVTKIVKFYMLAGKLRLS